MSKQRYTEDFKVEAARQISERGHPVSEVAKRLGVTTNSLYKWVKLYGESPERTAAIRAEKAETQRLLTSGTVYTFQDPTMPSWLNPLADTASASKTRPN